MVATAQAEDAREVVAACRRIDLTAQAPGHWKPAPRLGRVVAAACMHWVQDHLRAPTQSRTIGTPSVVADTDYHLLVTGEVDAMNGFGGYGRVVFVCNFLPEALSRTYVLADFHLKGQDGPSITNATDPCGKRTTPLGLLH
jgi:hypothetical protein